MNPHEIERTFWSSIVDTEIFIEKTINSNGFIREQVREQQIGEIVCYEDLSDI